MAHAQDALVSRAKSRVNTAICDSVVYICEAVLKAGMREGPQGQREGRGHKDDGESRRRRRVKEPRSQGAKSQGEESLHTACNSCQNAAPPGVHGIIQFTDAHPRFFRRRLELRHALLRLPRAGWISTFLLECLRNAVQPPGSRTYQLDPIV